LQIPDCRLQIPHPLFYLRYLLGSSAFLITHHESRITHTDVVVVIVVDVDGRPTASATLSHNPQKSQNSTLDND